MSWFKRTPEPAAARQSWFERGWVRAKIALRGIKAEPTPEDLAKFIAWDTRSRNCTDDEIREFARGVKAYLRAEAAERAADAAEHQRLVALALEELK